jgi:hypothetical protein
MPSGIYKRKKKSSKARKKASTKRAATKKKRGPGRPPGSGKKKRGRPPGSKTKTKRARPIKEAAPRKSQGRAGSTRVFADFGAVIEAIHEFGRLLDARSKLLIEAANQIGDAIRETADPELPAKVAIVEAEKKAGAAQGEPAPVS